MMRTALGSQDRQPLPWLSMNEPSLAIAEPRDTDLLVRSLAGVWRDLPPPEPLVVRQLAEHAPQFLEAGVGGLVWRRSARANTEGREALRELKQAYRSDALKAARHEGQIADLFARLAACEIDSLLCKGWSVARIYPETGLRPYNDIDLVIAPGRLSDAVRMLAERPIPGAQIDLHRSVPDLKSDDWGEVWRRARVLPLGDSRVRILGPEDQLRQLCLHFWRHLGCRPLWLCDIGAAMEAAAPAFDWEYCLRGRPAVADTVLCVLGLAVRLLKAQAAPEIAARASRLPGWLPRGGLALVQRHGFGAVLVRLPRLAGPQASPLFPQVQSAAGHRTHAAESA